MALLGETLFRVVEDVSPATTVHTNKGYDDQILKLS